MVQTKSLKDGLSVFERGENLLRNGISHFVFRFNVRDRVWKLELMQVKNGLFRMGLVT